MDSPLKRGTRFEFTLAPLKTMMPANKPAHRTLTTLEVPMKNSRSLSLVLLTVMLAGLLLSGATNSGTGPGVAGLAVLVVGPGQVTSNPVGINCPSICAAPFSKGSTVVLTATTFPGGAFAGWSG